MALDPNSAIGQAEVANAKLAEYFNAIYKYLVDTTGILPMPDFNEFVQSFDFTELHRLAVTRASDAASYENGATVENIHHMVAIIREHELRRKNKISYYLDGAADNMNESNFYSTMKVVWTAMLSGKYTEGQIV